MLVLWICAILSVVAFYPETPIGKMLKRILVDWPAEKLARLTPWSILFVILLLAVSAAAVVHGRSEIAMMVAQGAPEGLGWFLAFDIGTYLDLVAVAWLAAATLGLRVIYQRVRSVLAGAWRLVHRLAHQIAPRDRSRRRRSRVQRPSSDDEGWLGASFYAI